MTSLTRLLEPQAPNEIRKDAYLVISNLAAGSEDMIRHVMENKAVMMNVIAHITVPGHSYSQNPVQWTPMISNAYYYKNDEWKVTKEALWIIFNIISLGSDDTVRYNYIHYLVYTIFILCRELLQEHPDLPHTLAAVLNFMDLPIDVCEKIIESMTSLIQRSNKWIDFAGGKNPYVRIFLSEGVRTALPCIQEIHKTPKLLDACSKLEKLLVASEEDVVQTATISEGLESLFGLPTIVEIKSKSSKRRVLRNFEDGDVRLIENAVGNLCI